MAMRPAACRFACALLLRQVSSAVPVSGSFPRPPWYPPPPIPPLAGPVQCWPSPALSSRGGRLAALPSTHSTVLGQCAPALSGGPSEARPDARASDHIHTYKRTNYLHTRGRAESLARAYSRLGARWPAASLPKASHLVSAHSRRPLTHHGGTSNPESLRR